MSKEYSIREICKKYNKSSVWVRRALLQGKLKGHKVQIGSKTFKWLVKEEDLVNWRKSITTSPGRRSDGRNKFVIYCTKVEYNELVEVLKTNNLNLPLRRANLKKTK